MPATVAGRLTGRDVFLSFLLAGAIAGPFSLYVFWRQKVPDLLRTVGLRLTPGGGAKALGWGIVLGGAAAAAGVAYLKAVDRIGPLRKLKEESLQLGGFAGSDSFIWIALLAVAAAPLFEEYIFRGLVYRGMRRSTSVAPAVLLSAALFAIVHPPIAVIPVFCLGAAAALAFELAGGLLAPILVHAIYNAAVLMAS